MTRRPHAWLAGVATAVAGLLLATAGLAPAAGPATPLAGKSVHLTLNTYMPEFGAAAVNTLDTMLTGFEKTHPGINVSYQAATSSNAAALSSQLQHEIVSGNAPDVAQISFDGLKFAAGGLGAQSFDKLEGKAAVDKAFGGDHPFGKPATKLGVVDGQVYSIPWTLSTPVLFYNPTLLQQAGISAPPTTWAEMQTDATALKEKTGANGFANGCIGTGAGGSDWCLQAIIDSDGGKVLSGNRIDFADPQTVDALQTMQSLAASGGMVDLTSAQAVSQFAGGKLGFYLQSSALQSTLLTGIGSTFTLKDAAMPAFGSKAAKPTNSGSGLVMLTKDKAKQKAAWELIQYLTDDQSETLIAENIGYPPLRPGLVDDPKYLKSWSHASSLLPVNLAQLAKITPWEAYPGPNFAQIETLVSDTTTKVVFQGAKPKPTLESAQSQAQGLVSGS